MLAAAEKRKREEEFVKNYEVVFNLISFKL